MSGSTEKVSKRVQAAEWFNDLFKTRLEKDAKKILDRMQISNDNEVRGDTTFYYSRGSLQTGVETYLKDKRKTELKFMKLGDLSVTYWCDVPKKLWNEFKDDAKFNTDLYSNVNALTDKLVEEWGKRAIVWELAAAEADKKKDKKAVEHAMSEFEKDCVALQKECEKVAIEDIAEFFQTKVKAYGDYKRYKAKAGAKLAFTFVGIIVALAAVSTAATPAAPATLVPALIGLTVAVMSVGKQIRDLAMSAESVAEELEGNLKNLECNYLDEKGKPKKKTYRAHDFASGAVSGLTGGWSDIKFPSVKSMMGLTDTHRSKLDGLDVRMHDLGVSINAIVDSLIEAGKILEDNLTALGKKTATAAIKKAQKVLSDSQTAFEKLNGDFLKAFDKIVSLGDQIKTGLEKNAIWKEILEKINQALGSKNWATAGNLFATLALTAIGFSSGAPSNLAELITMPVSLGVTTLDTLREYTPEMMDSMLG